MSKLLDGGTDAGRMNRKFRKVAIVDHDDIGVYWVDEDDNLYEAEWPSGLPSVVRPSQLEKRGFVVIYT